MIGQRNCARRVWSCIANSEIPEAARQPSRSSPYHEIFEAEARLKDLLIAEDQACFEAELVGRQVSEFAGIRPIGREVCVPFCVVYELADGKITRGRIYFETDALRQQANAG
jgi:predicted ester cyclase